MKQEFTPLPYTPPGIPVHSMQSETDLTAANPKRSGVTGPQMWRQTKLRQWLLDGRRFNASDAARHFEVSRRTIMSDIEYLRQYGYAVEWDAARGTYFLEEESGEVHGHIGDWEAACEQAASAGETT